jgi:hypothetical protein
MTANRHASADVVPSPTAIVRLTCVWSLRDHRL